jgi:predicted TIM-barrel fold metal-dependent hydrolase
MIIQTDAQLDEWVQTMDNVGISKSIILSYSAGAKFDSVVEKYRGYKNRFEVWCGFDYTGYKKPGWQQHAVKELERCYEKGARGVGELGDKGLGEFYSKPTAGWGLHIDDPRMKPLLEKCAELHMPVSIHVAEDAWMYENSDSMNDGLMNAATWKVDMSKQGILDHDQLVTTLENAVKNNPKTVFIACHLANCCSDLSKLAKLFDKYPNLYADIAARYGEIAPIPRFVHDFMEKYATRIVYGTDMGTSKKMYNTTFRILETADEHFYEQNLFNYHWPLYGLSLSDATLKKIYNENGKKILTHQQGRK